MSYEALSICFAVYAFCGALFWFAWRVDSRRSLILTPFLVLMVNEILRVLPGFSYAVFRDFADYPYMLLVFLTGFVSLLCGFYFMARWLRCDGKEVQAFVDKPLVVENESAVFWAVLAGSLLLVLAGSYLHHGMPMVSKALLQFIDGADGRLIARQITSDRAILTKGHYFGRAYRGQGLILHFMQIGWPLVVSMAFIVFQKTKKTGWLALAAFLFLLSFIFIAGDGRRGPFIYAMVIYIILFSFIWRADWRFVVTAFMSIVILGIMLSLYSKKMHALIGKEKFLLIAAKTIMSRMFLANSLNDVYAIDLVRCGVIKYRLGMIHLRDLQSALPGVWGGLPFSSDLAMLLRPRPHLMKFASGTYITKAFVDFGLIGVGLSFLFIGGLAAFVQKAIIERVRKDPFQLALSASLVYCAGFMVMTSPIYIACSLVILVVFYLFLRTVAKSVPHVKAALGNARCYLHSPPAD